MGTSEEVGVELRSTGRKWADWVFCFDAFACRDEQANRRLISAMIMRIVSRAKVSIASMYRGTLSSSCQRPCNADLPDPVHIFTIRRGMVEGH